VLSSPHIKLVAGDGEIAWQLRFFIIAIVSAFALTGCEAIGGIFKAGVWTGVIIVVAVIAALIFGISRLFK
jgi:hypothetical protein